MSSKPLSLGLVALFAGSGALAAPIRVAPADPHYYFFKGRPILLITSAEHYGAVINQDFNYVAFPKNICWLRRSMARWAAPSISRPTRASRLSWASTSGETTRVRWAG